MTKQQGDEFAGDCDEIWQQRISKGDRKICPWCFGGREAHSFEPDPMGGAVALCNSDDEARIESHDRDVAANLRRGA